MVELQTQHEKPLVTNGPPVGHAARSVGFMINLGTAALTSCAHTTAFYPFHRVKNILQTQDAIPDVASGRVPRFTVYNSFGRITREQGLVSLWRGNVPYMLRHVPSTSLSFSLKDALADALPKVDKSTNPIQHLAWNLAAGGLAGSAALAVVYPLDFTSIRMAANLRVHSPGMMDELRRSRRSGGIASWYRGFGVSVLAIGAYKALYFGLYDTAKAYMGDPGPSHKGRQTGHGNETAAPSESGKQSTNSQTGIHTRPGFLQRWLAASLVVSVASTLTFPLDVIRKRLVVDTLLPLDKRQYPGGFWDCVRRTAAREGFKGFYASYAVDMTLRLGGGILLVVYDELKSLVQ